MLETAGRLGFYFSLLAPAIHHLKNLRYVCLMATLWAESWSQDVGNPLHWPRINVNFAPAIAPWAVAKTKQSWAESPANRRQWNCNWLIPSVVTHFGHGRDFQHSVPTFRPFRPLCHLRKSTSCSIAWESCTWCALNVDTDALALYSHLSQDMTATPLLSHFRPHFPVFPLFPPVQLRFSLWQHVRTTTIKTWMSSVATEGKRVVERTDMVR